jgi:UDP-2,3-diacylglucosamine pyrophosphatase LpxH
MAQPHLHYRSIFLSDTHLGFRGVRAEELSAFLKHARCERLYLVGDIVDLWALKQRWHWPVAHNHVVRRILKLAKRGTHVVYIPGNHDDALRQYAGLDLGGVRIALRAVHRMVDGRQLLVTHGDEYDLVVQNSRLLSLLGTWAYDQLLLVNRVVNFGRRVVGLGPWSFATAIKLKVKHACTFMSNYEGALLGEAGRRGLDGVVCGHIHQPLVRQAPAEPVYVNCGDWIERTSAIVEHEDGRLELVDAAAVLGAAGIEVAPATEAEDVPLDLGEAGDAGAVAAGGMMGAVA